jgi:phosphopantetheine--protein transferase-like protein
MSTVVGVGIDAVELDRLRAVLRRTPRFVDRAFTEEERAYCEARRDPTERFAARFAAKEAVLKVLGEGILRIPLRDIEVVRASTGQPSIRLTGVAATRAQALGVTGWQLSLTHTDATAMAVAVGLQEPPEHPGIEPAAEGRLLPDHVYFAGLDRKRNAAGALLFDPGGRLLVVKPTYETGWTIPGGAVDAGESPRQAVEREILEETGLRRRVGRLLAVEWRRGDPVRGESMLFVFDGGSLSEEEAGAIVLPPHELSTHAFLAPAEAVERLGRRAKSRRVQAALDALDAGSTVWLDHGVEHGGEPGPSERSS